MTKWGNQPVDIRADVYCNAVRPSAAVKWTVGFTSQFLFLKT